jgi:type II secretion system protein C
VRPVIPASVVDWRARAAASGPGVAAFALALLLLIDLSYSIWRLAHTPALGVPPRAQAADRPVSDIQTELLRIRQAHLFGSADDSSIVSAAPSAQQLRLFGVIASPGGVGYALIGEAGAAAKLYRQGERVSADLLVSSILPDRVILQRGTVPETLMLRRSTANPGAQSRAARRALAAASETPPPSADDESMHPPESAALAHALNLRPAMEGGHRVGMRITGSSDGGKTLAALGLNPGDVITGIAGADPGAEASLWNLMSSLNQGQSTTLEIERGGQHIQVTIDSTHPSATADPSRNATPN